MRVSPHAAVAAAVAMFAAVVPTSTAMAGPDTDRSVAYCEFDATFHLTPGLPTPDPSHFTTVDQTPDTPGHTPLYCTGRVNGHPVTGTGSYIERGSTIGDCASGDGTGQYEAWIPTVTGTQYLSGTFALHYDGVEGTGYETGPTIAATFSFQPTQGTCTPEDPLTAFVLHQEEVLYT